MTSGDADCDDPGESGLSSDCNDFVATIYPDAPEFCRGQRLTAPPAHSRPS